MTYCIRFHLILVSVSVNFARDYLFSIFHLNLLNVVSAIVIVFFVTSRFCTRLITLVILLIDTVIKIHCCNLSNGSIETEEK